jgi:hypothetical protein
VPAGDKVTLAVRPENVEVYAATSPPASMTNVFNGTVEQALFLCDYLDTHN